MLCVAPVVKMPLVAYRCCHGKRKSGGGRGRPFSDRSQCIPMSVIQIEFVFIFSVYFPYSGCAASAPGAVATVTGTLMACTAVNVAVNWVNLGNHCDSTMNDL